MTHAPDTKTRDTLFGIAELADAFGITTRTIRFYEDKGLLKPQRVGGQRVYTDADKKRLALILRAKTIGTKLSDIKTFLELYGQEGEGRMRQLEFVIEMTAKEIERLEEKKAEIETTLNELRVIHEGSKTRLAQRKSNSRYAR
ncbi:MAG: MerR family DNA-binding transcriptional regulator [Oceanicaulis sp.]|mgnify:CR=1 FL=1|jgi:DNA-binding transcriptional MerR regulator|nr:MerR family DNA-binding transcriptional regulator [Oceanicaulis sp.]